VENPAKSGKLEEFPEPSAGTCHGEPSRPSEEEERLANSKETSKDKDSTATLEDFSDQEESSSSEEPRLSEDTSDKDKDALSTLEVSQDSPDANGTDSGREPRL